VAILTDKTGKGILRAKIIHIFEFAKKMKNFATRGQRMQVLAQAGGTLSVSGQHKNRRQKTTEKKLYRKEKSAKRTQKEKDWQKY